jgi:iron complex transport system substrate-binding protein
MGMADLLVGRTEFDRGPALDSLPSVGGGVDPSLEALVALRPDVVLAWSTGKEAALRARLEGLGIPVFAVETTDTADVFRTIGNLGRITGRRASSDSLAASLRAEVEAVRASVAGRPRAGVFFVVWHDPPMTAGGGTFIHEVVELAGGRNVFGDATQPWPNVALEEVVRRRPDVIVLPVGEQGAARLEELRREPGWRDVPAVKAGRVVLIEADLMNRPGPRLGEAARRLAAAFHPAAARK